jgi:hypothetical protein
MTEPAPSSPVPNGAPSLGTAPDDQGFTPPEYNVGKGPIRWIVIWNVLLIVSEILAIRWVASQPSAWRGSAAPVLLVFPVFGFLSGRALAEAWRSLAEFLPNRTARLIIGGYLLLQQSVAGLVAVAPAVT